MTTVTKGLLLTTVAWMLGVTSVLAQLRCDDPKADPWIREVSENVTSFNQLLLHGIDLYGDPLSCEGWVTTVFDGNSFGRIRLEFSGGASFEIETMPPETSVVTLRDSAGLEAQASALAILESYTADIGLGIDWGSPDVSPNGAERIETYWDPDDGLNASAHLVYREEKLVAMAVSMAL